MQLACKSCGRSFDVNGERAREFRSARCLCGGLIALPSPVKTKQLGKYVLQERIAVGGMGEIWRAKMPGIEGFERQVAIKKMLPHLSADRDFINMLVKEAKLTVLLHHPNIVQVFDLAREGDEYYIAMEYVPSVNLSTLLEYCANSGQFTPVALAVDVVLQALEGLSYAHTLKGADGEPMHILHRDVTPQNILITREGWAKVTDFGIAKAKNEISTTRPGTIRGKLGYIAPEQLKSSDADQRVDIFCAGVVLWESLATRRLFKGTDEVDTLRLIVEARVPSLTTMRRDITPALDRAVARALAREPDDRYASAAEFKDALLAAIRPSTADDFQKLTREFLAQNGQAFERPAQDQPENPTISLDTDTPDPAGGTVSVSEILLAPPRTGSRLGAVVTLLVIAALAAGGWLFWKKGGGRLLLRGDSPVPLTSAEVQAAVDGAGLQLTACYTGRVPRDAEPHASLGVLPTGQIVDVAVIPSTLGKAGPCLANALRGVQMRSHPGPRLDTTVRLPGPSEAAREPAPDTQPTHPGADDRAGKPLSPDEIQRTVRQYGTPIARCFGQVDASSAPETVNARLAILPNGRVGSVELVPELDNPAATRCLVGVIKGMRFRQSSKSVEVSLPLHLQRFTIK